MKINKYLLRSNGIYYLFGILLTITFFANGSVGIDFITNKYERNEYIPDSIPPDSTEDDYFSDTIMYSDGLDIIYEYNDSVAVPDSTTEGFRILPFTPGVINVVLGGTSKTINRGIYGLHIGGMFDHSTLPNDGSSEYGWQWLIDLAPDVLRFPSGSYSKFTHLLHDPYTGLDTKGYGYNLFEIARYFDWTDGIMNFDHDALTSPDINHILYDDEPQLNDWIDADDAEHFDKFRKKCFSQSCETRRYIDDFIELVNQLDSAYPGRPQTRVILDLNILSETATECRAIADYLRSHDVNVVGVEMGNETYADFFCRAMEFHDFNNYFSFIQGTNLFGNGHVLADLPGTSDDMWADHDYLTAFKTGGGFNYKIGVCGMPLGNDFAFRIGLGATACAETNAWNDSLRSKYDQKISGTTKYKFDAVIMHTYFEPDNYQDIPINNLASVTTCSSDSDLWKYDIYDPRLVDAFDKVLGVGGESGNFRDFLVRTTGDYKAYKISYDEFNAHFDFDLTTADKKDLWVTEANLKTSTKSPTLTETDKRKIDIYANTFSHGHLLFNWWLKNIKINFDNDYRQNFFTYFTLQNYADGTSTDLVSLSDSEERAYYGIDECPHVGDCGEGCSYDTTFDKRNYEIRRTTYFTTHLLSNINKNSLKYLPSNYWIGHGNLNVAPTAFIDGSKEYVYLFYSNVKNEFQNYVVDPDNLVAFFPGAGYVDLGAATITYLQANQLYSTSGKSALFDTLINYCYKTHDHPFEITPITETSLNPVIITEDNIPYCTGDSIPLNGCLSAPAYSIGFFKIPITAYYPPPRLIELPAMIDVNIYPNPATNQFFISPDYSGVENISTDYQVLISDLQGKLFSDVSVIKNQPIDISGLAAGCYQITISDGINRFHKRLIKTI